MLVTHASRPGANKPAILHGHGQRHFAGDRPAANLAVGITKALRPRQWLKNVLVVAAPLATLGGNVHYDYRDVAYRVAVAFVLPPGRICDLSHQRALDVDADRQHPTKRFRPIAAGVVAPALAYTLAIALSATSLAVSLVTAPNSLWSSRFTSRSSSATLSASNTKPCLTFVSSRPVF